MCTTPDIGSGSDPALSLIGHAERMAAEPLQGPLATDTTREMHGTIAEVWNEEASALSRPHDRSTALWNRLTDLRLTFADDRVKYLRHGRP
jgi:hypothetical protein